MEQFLKASLESGQGGAGGKVATVARKREKVNSNFDTSLCLRLCENLNFEETNQEIKMAVAGMSLG